MIVADFPPPLVLVAPNSLTVASVGVLLEPAFSESATRPHEVSLDLRRVRFVTPFALAALATQIEAAYGRGQTVRILCPVLPDTLMYLAVSGFFAHMRDRADIQGAVEYIERGPSTSARTVLPLTRIEGNADVDQALSDVRVLIRGLAKEEEWFKRFRNLVVELCGNVFRHADIQVGYVVAQRYQSSSSSFIELAIGDAGCGVIHSLAQRHPYLPNLDPGEALRVAVGKQLSSQDDLHGGNGFYGLRKIATDRRGRFVLHSGRGRVSAYRGASSLQSTSCDHKLLGTQVMVTVDCD